MRKVYVLLLAVFLSVHSFAATITWIGVSGGNWNTASNWSPATVPTSVDDVVFNTSVTVNMDILISPTAYAINSLKITNNVTVVLQRTQAGGGVRILRVQSTDLTTMGLEIDAGSTLLIHGINTNASGNLEYILDFAGAVGVTGEIFGELQFSGVGSGGTADNTRLRVFTDASNNASLAVKSGGVIKYFDLTGNTTSSTGAYLTMEGGSTYEIIKNGGSFPDGAWAATSLAKASCTGANPPIFNGTIYGNLEWNCPSQNNYNLATSMIFNDINLISTNPGSANAFRITNTASAARSLTINGNLTISSNSKLEITGPSVTSNGGTLNLKGHLTNAGIITTSGIASTVNDFILNGTSLQNITSTGTMSGTELDFIMNNTAGAQLLSALTLPGNTSNSLQLTNGKIKTTSSFLLTMIDNAAYTINFAGTSFIEGPLRKIGNESFAFPVGVGAIFAPIGLTSVAGESPTDEFIGEYKRIDPRSIHGTVVEPPMDHTSSVEYWSLTTSNSPSKLVSLAITFTSFCYTLAQTYVSRWDGSVPWWTTQGSVVTLIGPTSPPLVTGIITSVVPVSAYGDFTLITNLSTTFNPLPIKLVAFDAIKSGNRTLLSWELVACCSADARFEMEKSLDRINFSSFSSIRGSETNRFYTSIDSRLGKGITYYRLKMIEADGKISYSKIVAVINDTKGLLITSIAPNPVHDEAILTLSTAKKGVVLFQLYNLSGAIVKQWQSNVAEGTNNIPVTISGLPAGVYQLSASVGDTKTVFRLVKQ